MKKIQITIEIETVSDSTSAPSPSLDSVIRLVAEIIYLVAVILIVIAAL